MNMPAAIKSPGFPPGINTTTMHVARSQFIDAFVAFEELLTELTPVSTPGYVTPLQRLTRLRAAWSKDRSKEFSPALREALDGLTDLIAFRNAVVHSKAELALRQNGDPVFIFSQVVDAGRAFASCYVLGSSDLKLAASSTSRFANVLKMTGMAKAATTSPPPATAPAAPAAASAPS